MVPPGFQEVLGNPIWKGETPAGEEDPALHEGFQHRRLRNCFPEGLCVWKVACSSSGESPTAQGFGRVSGCFQETPGYMARSRLCMRVSVLKSCVERGCFASQGFIGSWGGEGGRVSGRFYASKRTGGRNYTFPHTGSYT